MAAESGLVVEDPSSGFCGAVLRVEAGNVVLEDREGKQRAFPMHPAGFLLEGKPVTLVRPKVKARRSRRSASGSVRVEGTRARTARASRIWVEGLHDEELVERIWGHDLRVAGVVVEPLHGVDELPTLLEEFAPGAGRRVGVLVDHLVDGSKESRIVGTVANEHVLVTGHPYVDIWEAVKPSTVGISAWPSVERGKPWKETVCAELGWGEPAHGWRTILAAVSGFRDVQPPLINAVERLIDFVTETAEPAATS